MCAQTPASAQGIQDAIQVWGVVSGCIAKGSENSELPGVVRVRLWEVWSTGGILLMTCEKAMECQYCLVFFHFLPPSTLNHPCLLCKHAISPPLYVLTQMSLHVAVCLRVISLQTSENITGSGSSSLLQTSQCTQGRKPNFQHLERLMLCNGKGLSGLWVGGRLADVAAWGSVTW